MHAAVGPSPMLGQIGQLGHSSGQIGQIGHSSGSRGGPGADTIDFSRLQDVLSKVGQGRGQVGGQGRGQEGVKAEVK